MAAPDSLFYVQQVIIFREKPNRDLVNPVGDEVGGEDINRIVEMPEQDNDAKENRHPKEKPAEGFVVPEDQGYEKGEAGMAREKQVSRESDLVHDAVVDVQGGLLE